MAADPNTVLTFRQIVRSFPVIAAGEGFTVRVKVLAGPTALTPPLVKVGKTVIVATTGEAPVLTAIKDAILPVPDVSMPILALLLLQA